MLDKTTLDTKGTLVYTQRLNPVTGENTWEPHPETYDFHREVARSSYADMLHDTDRNRKYYEAIRGAIEFVHSQGRLANVLDIGTGTGLLSMMAAKSGADSVIACEAFPPIAECARDIVKLNGFEEKIQVITKRSTDLKVGSDGDLKARCNILVTEVFDTELIGEGAFQTFDHAHKELLEKNAIVIPHHATMYAQIIESPLTFSWNRLKDVYDEDGELVLKIPPGVRTCPGSCYVHDLQLTQIDSSLIKTITPPNPILEFNWSNQELLKYKRNVKSEVNVICDGLAQAVFVWWDLKMDAEGKIVLSCAPSWAYPASGPIPWRDHWMQSIYYFPKEINVQEGHRLHLLSSHDEYSLWFNLKSEEEMAKDTEEELGEKEIKDKEEKKKKKEEEDYARPLCDCNVHLAHSRTRFGQINDGRRIKKYQTIFHKHMDKESIVLLLGNGFYNALGAWKFAKRLVFVDDSFLSRSVLNSFISHNSINNADVFEDMDQLKAKFDVSSITLVISDEHFKTSILPWDNLAFAYQYKEIADLVREDVKILPKVVGIKAMAVEFVDLQKIRAPVLNCEGFLMAPFDNLINHSCRISDDSVEAQPLWEYPCYAKSEVTSIADISVELIVSGQNLETKGCINLEGDKRHNGVAMWVEWDLDGSESNRITTGPLTTPIIGQKIQWDMHVRQGVVLFPQTLEALSINFQFKFDVLNGDFSFKFNV